MIIAVTGSRHAVELPHRAWVDALIASNVRAPFVVRHGGATGIDTLVAQWCAHYGIATEAWPADWSKHGRAAGPIRNRAMLTEARDTPDAQRFVRVEILFAFPGGRGTADCVRAARDFGIRVVEVRP